MLLFLLRAIAHSHLITSWISDRVSFVAPVEIVPGEDELEALALGSLRVIRGEESAHEFVAPELSRQRERS